MIRLQYAIIAEFARQGSNGKVDLLGVFDRIYASTMPTQHRNLALAIQIVSDEEDDLGKKTFLVRFLSPGGATIFEQHGAMELRPQGGPWLAAGRLVFALDGVPLMQYGKHLFELHIDGQVVATHPLLVSRPEPGARRQ